MNKPSIKIGQRWMLVNYNGFDRYLLAEVEEVNCYGSVSERNGTASLRVLQIFHKQSVWSVDRLMRDEHLLQHDYWIYLDGQDKV